MLAQEDVQQIVDAMEQLDWVQWCKQQMQADGGGMGSMPGGDDLPAPPPDVGGPEAGGAPPMGGPPAPPAAPPMGGPPAPPAGPPGGDDPDKKKMSAGGAMGGAMGGAPGPKMNYGAGENSSKPAAGNVDPDQTKPSTNNSVDGMTGGDAASSYPGGEKGKEISVEKFSKLEERLAAAERRAVNADRKAALTEYRMQYAFDLDAEVQRCDYSKMSEANFADHLTAIEQNYRPIMAEQDVFVPDHVPSMPGARRQVETADGPGRAHYSKDVSDEARIICEDAAIAGRTVDYSQVLDEVARKRGLARA